MKVEDKCDACEGHGQCVYLDAKISCPFCKGKGAQVYELSENDLENALEESLSSQTTHVLSCNEDEVFLL